MVQQALYLDTRKAQGDTFIRNGVGAAGAAVAAIWALATQLPATVANLPINAKLTFFALAVVAYVTKDRIKALTNEYLVPKLRSFDFVSRIKSGALTAIGLGMLDTRLKEAMRQGVIEPLDPVLTAEALLSTVSPDAMAWMTISDERAVAAKANLSQLWRRALRQK